MSIRQMLAAAAGAGGISNYFGDGSDGDAVISTNTSLAATEDGNPVVKHYNTLQIDKEVFLTLDNRCKAFLIYVKGDCTIEGHLNMDARGASAEVSADLDLSRFEKAGDYANPPEFWTERWHEKEKYKISAIYLRYHPEFARYFHDLTDVRVERVKDISQEDAQAEGVGE